MPQNWLILLCWTLLENLLPRLCIYYIVEKIMYIAEASTAMLEQRSNYPGDAFNMLKTSI